MRVGLITPVIPEEAVVVSLFPEGQEDYDPEMMMGASSLEQPPFGDSPIINIVNLLAKAEEKSYLLSV